MDMVVIYTVGIVAVDCEADLSDWDWEQLELTDSIWLVPNTGEGG